MWLEMKEVLRRCEVAVECVASNSVGSPHSRQIQLTVLCE